MPAGLTRYASRVFGAEYRDNFFAAMFNLRKVTRHVLEPSGATFTTRDSDFLVSDSRDFHPTDVHRGCRRQPARDRHRPLVQALLSDLAARQAGSARRDLPRPPQGRAAPADPRGRKLAWATMTPADLARLLDDARPAVQSRALHQLANGGRGRGAGARRRRCARSRSAEARRNAVWALTRIEGARAREAVRLALDDRDESVRHAALHSAGLWRDAAALPQLVDALKSGRPAVQRAAAEALGRVGDARAVPDLLARPRPRRSIACSNTR